MEFEIISNLWKVSGLSMGSIIQLLAIPVMLVSLWFAGGDRIKPLTLAAWNWVKSLGKGGSVTTGNSTAFETLMDAVDQLAHDRNFAAASAALKLAESVASPLKTEPSNG